MVKCGPFLPDRKTGLSGLSILCLLQLGWLVFLPFTYFGDQGPLLIVIHWHTQFGALRFYNPGLGLCIFLLHRCPPVSTCSLAGPIRRLFISLPWAVWLHRKPQERRSVCGYTSPMP